MARLAVVSNRVSVPSGDGAARAGGLEVALRPALQHNGGVWLGWSGKIGTQDKLRTLLLNHSLLSRDNVVITPHIAFNSREAVGRILSTTVDNLLAFLGGTPQNVVTLR